MQLNLTTDYAIRLVLYLATVERAAGSTEISDLMCIPRGQFGSISKTLRGTNGGFRLAKQPEEISLHEIVNAMEGTTRINRCLDPDGYCSRNGAPNCPVHKFYSRIQSQLDQAFQEVTIASLLRDA